MSDWKTRSIFNELSDSYAKYYSPTEYAAVGEIIMLFKDIESFSKSVYQRNTEGFLTVSSFLHLVVQNYETDSGEEPNTSGRKNAFTPDQATKEAGPILEPTKMMRCMIQRTLPFGREENLVQVCLAENKKTKLKCP